jgi:Ca2+-transporting ATPase
LRWEQSLPIPLRCTRGPRSSHEHVLGGGLWQRITWTGSLIATVTISAALFAKAVDAPWQTLTFLVLGLSQLGVAIALRRPRASGGPRLRFLDVAVAGALVAQVGPVVFAPLRDLLGLEPLPATQFAAAVAVAIIPGAVVGVLRLLHRRS